MSLVDEPESGTGIQVTLTYPEGLSEDDVLAGLGMDVSIVATGMTGQQVLVSMLRVCETLAAASIRDSRSTEQSKLIEPDPTVEFALTTMNARLMAISMMSEMSMTPNTAMGFSL